MMIFRTHFTLIFALGFAATILSIQLTHFVFWIPLPKSLKPHPLEKHFGTLAYCAAYTLSLLRLPYAILPYGLKLVIFLVFGGRYKAYWDGYIFQGLRVIGDYTNLALTSLLMMVMLIVLRMTFLLPLVWVVAGAEFIRLASEKDQMIYSALWQFIPHRQIATMINARQESHPFWKWLARGLSRYRHYYMLDDDGRMRHILNVLKTHASLDHEASAKLRYVNGFRIIAHDHGLRCASVRSVAVGEIFIHKNWTSDPWLLIGQALRRSPWVFDPRYVRRPFYYRSHSNRLATLFVLRHARWSPLYAWYQFGHEIKVARYDLFFRACRWLGFELEETVREDGTYRFDPFIGWLENRKHIRQRALWSDDEVMRDSLIVKDTEETISAQEIAARYTYPQIYVEEVLLKKIEDARNLPAFNEMTQTIS